MLRHVFILTGHDLAVACKSKTIFLLICIPLFVYGTLLMVDQSDAPVSAVQIALLEEAPIDPGLRTHLESARGMFDIHEVGDRQTAERLLKNREIDGLVMPDDRHAGRVRVLVLKRDTSTTLIIVQRMAALQIAVEGDRESWLSELHSLQSDALEVQSMPVWILMIVLLVAFFVIPSQVAEEKERQTLLGLLQTPMHETEWLAAKILYGMFLMFASVLALQVLGQTLPVQGSFYLMLGAGCFSFGAMGVALGLLCRNQASARTLGVIVYLPLLLPAALSDQSQSFRTIAPWLPSHAFFGPIQSILLDHERATAFPIQWLLLVLMGVVACLGAYRLMKTRWLM